MDGSAQFEPCSWHLPAICHFIQSFSPLLRVLPITPQELQHSLLKPNVDGLVSDLMEALLSKSANADWEAPQPANNGFHLPQLSSSQAYRKWNTAL